MENLERKKDDFEGVNVPESKTEVLESREKLEFETEITTTRDSILGILKEIEGLENKMNEYEKIISSSKFKETNKLEELKKEKYGFFSHKINELGKIIKGAVNGITDITLEQISKIVNSLSKTGGEALRNIGKPSAEVAGEGVREVGKAGAEVSEEAIKRIVPASAEAAGSVPPRFVKGLMKGLQG